MYGAIRHRTQGKKAVRAYIYGGKARKMNVGIIVYRFRRGVNAVRYNAEACFFPGGKAAIEPGDPREMRRVYLNKRRTRLQSERCADGEGAGPTQAVKRALAALSKKKL